MVIQTYLNNEIWLELNVAFVTIFSQAQFTQRFQFPDTKMFYAGLPNPPEKVFILDVYIAPVSNGVSGIWKMTLETLFPIMDKIELLYHLIW